MKNRHLTTGAHEENRGIDSPALRSRVPPRLTNRSRNHVDFRGVWIYFFSRLWVGFGPLRAVSGAQVAKLEKTPVRDTPVAKFDTGPLS